ncbi:MAG: DHH family phosphoesterase [Bacilli bacterium]|nr:DHH family phosphoesterase [Bacilli bacterium]
MDEFCERLLEYYDLSEEDYARISREPSFSDIPRIDDDLAVTTAKSRIQKAIDGNEKVLVYGDYDTDGIMATSIMMRCFHKLHKTASFFIPSRYEDGYGLNMDNAMRIAKSGYHLVILVDNGVGCLQEVSYLLSQGIETIIIDHHELPEVLPPALATIHPKLLPYGQFPVSAGYLCFLFSLALLGEKDDYLLTLGAISTVSDCMPIRGHNKTLLALSLRAIRANKYPELSLLTERQIIDEFVLSMNVVPIINAVGRIVEDHSLARVVHFFADEDPKDKQRLAEWMKQINEMRKKATAEAIASIRPDVKLPAITVVGRLKEGLNGLLANRLLSSYRKPCCVFSQSKKEPDCYVGSLRGKEGFNVMEFLHGVSSLTVRFGGHDFAGGVTIKKDDYPAFKDAFEKYAFRHPISPDDKTPIPLSLKDITSRNYRIIRSFGPFGHDYEEPKFLLDPLPISSLQFTRDGKMLSSPLGYDAKLFSFSYGRPLHVDEDETVRLIGNFRLEDYRGKVTIRFLCEKAPVQ